MALNQILNGVDEVIDGTPKYTITDNGDGTKDIELANEIVQEGTNLNRNLLNKIDNVLSYLQPSVEKVVSGSVEKTIVNNILPNSISPIWSNRGIIGDKITMELTHFDNISPEMYFSTNDTNILYANDSAVDNEITVSSYHNRNTYISSEYLLANLSMQGYNANYFARFYLYGRVGYKPYLYQVYDMKTPCKITINYHFGNSSITGLLQYSDDGITWADITTLVTESDQTYSTNEFHRYYRVAYSKGVNTTQGVLIYYFYISSLVYQASAYQNQFTLDNNGTFTNNQRVLVETPKNSGDSRKIEKHYTNNILPTNWEENTYGINYDGILLNESKDSVNISGGSYYDNGSTKFIITRAFDNDISTVYSTISTDTEQYIKFDFSNPIKIVKLDTFIKCSGNASTFLPVEIQGSNDSNQWTTLYTISNQQEQLTTITLSNTNYYKYYRLIRIGEIGTEYSPDFYRTRFLEIKINECYIMENEPLLDGVTSNTINNIPCDTLLQPSTKYELIYKEDTNKFELGGLLTLFDITLTQAVNQVDLIGISDMLKEGKLYALLINSDGISVAGNIDFGNSSTGYIGASYNAGNLILLFTKNNVIGGYEYITFISTGNNSVINNKSILNGYEYVKCHTSSTTFNVGTRIIIKEVA